MRPTDTLHMLPTHLGVRDPVLWMLDDVQLVKVAAGVLLAAFIVRQAVLPVGVRTALIAVVLLGTAACALVSIDGRSLDDWLLLAGRYWSPAAHPRLAIPPARAPLGAPCVRYRAHSQHRRVRHSPPPRHLARTG